MGSFLFAYTGRVSDTFAVYNHKAQAWDMGLDFDAVTVDHMDPTEAQIEHAVNDGQCDTCNAYMARTAHLLLHSLSS